ncbi:hypothetical protein [Subtercola lobariae]|uniref:Uncharacterized protein n=1 Tax=Subtercola lobariae TaxID=1588641 RepID=A0A917ETV7_9MICO|nr:hypothetical protein [Subtercola lobariae]GGF11374.1 hypothetical protein GCM10011399_01510 [Subtercola lobariae]
MHWWDVVILVTSVIAALGVILEIWYRWWSAPPRQVKFVLVIAAQSVNGMHEIQVRVRAMGSLVMFEPVMEITGSDAAKMPRPPNMPNVFDSRSETVAFTLSIPDDAPPAYATVEIRWVDQSNRSTRPRATRAEIPGGAREDWKPYRLPKLHKQPGRWQQRREAQGQTRNQLR